MAWEAFKIEVAKFFATSGVAILKAILIFAVGSILIKFILKLFNRLLSKGKVEKSARKFIYSVIKYVLYFLLLMIIASIFNISITGFIAVFSALGLAVSLALQSSLSNLANGIVILVTRPFRESDLVKIGDYQGVIKEVRLTHTVIIDAENKQVSIPNKTVVESVLINASVSETKQMVYTFLVSYASDVEQVKSIILKSFSRTDYVLPEPKPMVYIDSLKENGILFKATCTVESKHYKTAYHSILEDIFNEFKKEKIVLPYAQMEVRIKQEKESLPFYQNSKLKNKPKEKVVKPEKPYENLEKQEEKVKEEEKEITKDYLDYVIEEEIEIEDTQEVLPEKQENLKIEFEPKQEAVKPEKKQKVVDKLFKKKTKKDKKPTIIIKK